MQVYKVTNLNKEGKAIYIAGSGLYSLIENEQAVMCAALSFNPVEIENRFNEVVNAAVRNYSVFLERVYRNRMPFEIEMMTNFADFFNLVIDIKKKEEAEMVARELETGPIAAATAMEEVDAAIAEAAATKEEANTAGAAAITKPTPPKKARK